MIEIDFRKLRKLVRMLENSQIAELEIEDGPKKIRLAKFPKAMAPPFPVQFPTIPAPEAAKPPTVKTPPAKNIKQIKSPTVGTFYAAPSPEAEPYIQVGDIVQEGQTLCIIEAMRLKNEIPSGFSGRIVEILAEDGQPVEYDLPLFTIDLSP